MARFEISKAEYEEILALEKKTRDKNLSKRLQVLMLRYEGLKVKEIAARLNLHPASIPKLCARYRRSGLEEFARNKYTSHNRNLSHEQEAAVLAEMEKKAGKGRMLTVHDIKGALDQAVGRETEPSYVYKVLKRHGWRKVMPRSKHPKAADSEAVEASKKLKAVYWTSSKNLSAEGKSI